MMKSLPKIPVLLLCTATCAAHAAELHVATTGDDKQPGTSAAPLRTIQRAADLARPGDTIIVHQGIYRERINPPRGGVSDDQRITYQAAPGAKVEIKGSEIVKGWSKVQGDVWEVTLPNSFFGDFNPYSDLIRGDWFDPRGRQHHTGAVYLRGEWLAEAANMEDLLAPGGAEPLWFAEVDERNTTIRARFKDIDPNQEEVEINVRRTVFYPDRPGRDFLTIRGFTMRHAATPWAPPTAEQIGLIGTHWSKGWIIENNEVSHSVCTGIALGKYGDGFDNTSASTAEGYVKTVERAQAYSIPWTRERIGHHVVRNNRISHCEQAGIVGSLGAAFSTVEGNVIHDIHIRRLFSGAEMAGIKFHGAIDTIIRRNHIFRCNQALWLDWMSQGTRITANLFHDNLGQDLFVEVNHGPFMVDNNLLLSPVSLVDMSQGGAYAHNLFGGKLASIPELSRETPYHPAHSTRVTGLANIEGGDNRFHNNLFVGAGADAAPGSNDPGWQGGHGLWVYDFRKFPLQAGGNVYYSGARPHAKESDALIPADHHPAIRLVMDKAGSAVLHLDLGNAPRQAETVFVTSELLGDARIPKLPYVQPDGSPLKIDTDYFGRLRDGPKPTSGPFEKTGDGPLALKVWQP